MQTGKDLDLDFELIFRATQDFFDENEEWMYEIASNFNKPILLEVLPERHHYWAYNIDLANIFLRTSNENPTIQIEVESGK